MVALLVVLGYAVYLRVQYAGRRIKISNYTYGDEESTEKGSKYLLGVGKADITGYGHRASPSMPLLI